jgi:hypothetical protein
MNWFVSKSRSGFRRFIKDNRIHYRADVEVNAHKRSMLRWGESERRGLGEVRFTSDRAWHFVCGLRVSALTLA